MDFFYKINSIFKSYKYFINTNLFYEYEQEYDDSFNINLDNFKNNSNSDNDSSYNESNSDINFNFINSENSNVDNLENNNLKKLKKKIIDDKEYINNISNYYSLMPLSVSLFLNKPISVIDNIFVGNIYNASNWSVINNLNINYIVNFNKKIENFYPNEKNIKFMTVDLEPQLENIEEILDMINLFQTKIDLKYKKETNILLLSLAGNNTPCVIMIAYLIHKYNFDFKKALLYVCKKIPNYNINKKYFEILKVKYSDNN